MMDVQTPEVGASSTWDNKTLYTDRSSEDEQLLIRLLLRNTKNTNMAGDWNLKFTFYFLQTTHEPLHSDKWSFVQSTIMDIPTGFIWTIVFVGEAFEYCGGSKFWGYVGTNAEPLCIEFCNLCHVIHLYIIIFIIIKFDTTVLSWNDNSIIPKSQFHLIFFET
jgi:hypothetical protein